ncbi:DNA recombination protein RmuC [Hoeflea sp. G2-23]|uniref:DNA recombination protein RmuC homolog n=1 Tax=Hoeflea algicola TaxID=2983763 RepID=A0ABT3ZCP1_9HYPH|nr:DNA recombination protein RmuC [Hoeflea algicola]MCY0149570.1 DNA recombination protein RmuC [Hoeflea algicola]
MDSSTDVFSTRLFDLGGSAVTLGHALLGLAVALLLLFGWLALALTRANRLRAQADAAAAARTAQADARLAEILKAQSEMQGRMGTMAELFGARQAELNQSIGQRLDGMTQRIGTTLTDQTRTTHENLSKLQERLAVIDTAQANIQSLARDVVGLQAILSNKQTRGAFGQSRMETIVQDGLPMGAFSFQPTLSNGMRPDCTIAMPNDAPDLVIDAKFPLEAWNAMRAAETEGSGEQAAQSAQQRFRRDIEVHIRDISEKYLLAGETQDTAFLFVPSESIFAEIHENFEAIVHKAQRARVVIVSPSLLMLSIQVIQALLKDARMREQAHLIQGEVLRLMEDLSRLDDRTRKLQAHFSMAQKDVDLILTSSDKLSKRGAKIEALEFAQIADDAKPAAATRPAQESAPTTQQNPKFEPRSTTLKLRVVDEDE